MRKLTSQEIEKLSRRKGAKQMAVSNFLMSMGEGNACDAFSNLAMDAKSYKWNAATYSAISDGISLASRG